MTNKEAAELLRDLYNFCNLTRGRELVSNTPPQYMEALSLAIDVLSKEDENDRV